MRTRAIRWVVPFMTVHDKPAQIDIYEDGWTGGVTNLQAAANPITTEVDNSDDLMEPLRGQTGIMRLIDNGDLDGLLPQDNKSHYIELKVRGQVVWCGYMKSATFSGPWDATPVEVEYPIMSGLSVLDSVYLTNPESTGRVSLAGLVRECIDLAEIEYNKIYTPVEGAIIESGLAKKELVMNYMEVSRSIFFTPTDADTEGNYKKYDAMTAGDTLREVMKMMGWVIQERGKDLYMQSVEGKSEYAEQNYEDYGYIVSTGTYVQPKRITLTPDMIEGASHQVDVMPGAKSITVTGEIHPAAAVELTLTHDQATPSGYELRQHMNSHMESVFMYKNGTEKDYFKFWQYEPGDYIPPRPHSYVGSCKTLIEIPYDEKESNKRIGCALQRNDIYSIEGTTDKKRYTYTDRIYCRSFAAAGKYPKTCMYDGPADKYPVLRYTTRESVEYAKGALVLSFGCTVPRYGITNPDINFDDVDSELTCSVRVGPYYWNGTAWTGEESSFVVQYNTARGVIDTKTLDMPYNDASGYIMPIDMMLTGVIEFTLYPVFGEDTYLSALSIKYVREDDGSGIAEKESNKYQSDTGAAYEGDKHTKIMMSSDRGGQRGLSTLSLSSMYYIPGQIPGARTISHLFYAEEGEQHPESHLLSKLKRLFGRNMEKLTIGVKQTALLPCDVLQYGGREYAITSRRTEWSEEHEELIIMSL